MIQSVNSNTSLTLDKPFAETTATNSNYRILLNTAAHFPSDTAAKVERALEQLSDINEAAINNDRTVTAATKVNGKGLSSTMGDLHLNPASINTNRGGTINFHYNQASSATSSIYENASGQIRIDGQLSLGSGVRGSVWAYTNESNNNNFVEFCGWSSDQYNSSTGRRLGNMRIWRKSDTVDQVDLYSQIPLASDSSQTCSSGINLIARADGTHSELISANPATDNNSTQIATTAFVNSRLKSVKNLGSNYVMNISDFGTTAGYYQCGSLDTSDAKNFISGTFGGSSDTGDYRFLVEEFYYGRFWNSEWQGWRVVPTVEEGTWTPNIYGSNTVGAFNYTTQTGAYVKIGRLVYIRGYLAGTCTTAPLGQVRINGLPFAPTESAGTSGYAAATGGSDYSMKRVANLYIGPSYLTVRIQNKSDNTIDYANFSSTSSDAYYIKMVANDSITLQFSCVYVTNTR